LDGYPRSKEDGKNVFMNKILIETGEEEEGDEPKYDFKPNDKIIPQYAIAIEAEDGFLVQRAKDLPPQKTQDNHHNDAGMTRRLKEYNTRNAIDSGETVRDFFNDVIGYQNVLVVDS